MCQTMSIYKNMKLVYVLAISKGSCNHYIPVKKVSEIINNL